MGFMKIHKPGLLTTIQDLGRYGYQKYGMPVAGAMDEYAFRVANILVGNRETEACLEITLLGPDMEFLGEGVIAVTGGDLGAKLNGSPLSLWEACRIKKGDRLVFEGAITGCRAYLAVAGGIKVPLVMGSKSTFLPGRIGGMNGRGIRAGDEIEVQDGEIKPEELAGRRVPEDYRYGFTGPIIVRVLLGPQENAFTGEGINTFLSSEYEVTNEANRMGYRLRGPKIEHKNGADIISDGIAMGSIQVPGHGSPIIMMADRQTTGGYAKIATIITPDLNIIAQSKPGDKIHFQKVSTEEAHQIYLSYEEKIRKLESKLFQNVTEKPDKSNTKKIFRLKVNGKSYTVEVEEII